MNDDEKNESNPIPVVRETVRLVNPTHRMTPPGQESPMKLFEATWTPQEQVDDLKDWSRPRIAEFIQAMSLTVQSMFESAESASSKGLVSLALRMREMGVERIDFQASFEGSRFGLAREAFQGSIQVSGSGSASEASGGSSRSVEAVLGDPKEQTSPISEKMRPLWDDAAGCLSIYDQIREALGDAEGTHSAQDAALLVLHLEHASLRNAGSAHVNLAGITEAPKQGEPTRAPIDAVVQTQRVAVEFPSMPSAKAKM